MMTAIAKNEMETMIQLVTEGTTDANTFMAEYQRRSGVARSPGAFGLYLTTLLRCNILEPTDALHALIRSFSKLASEAKAARKRAKKATSVGTRFRPQNPGRGEWIYAADLNKILQRDLHHFAKANNVRYEVISGRGFYHGHDVQAAMAKLAQDAINIAEQWHTRLKQLKEIATMAKPVGKVATNILDVACEAPTPSAQFLMECVRAGKLTPAEAAKLLKE